MYNLYIIYIYYGLWRITIKTLIKERVKLLNDSHAFVVTIIYADNIFNSL